MVLRRSLAVVLILGILSPATQSFHFELQSAHTKCVAEEINANVMTVGKYSVVNPNEGHPLPLSHKISVRVTSPSGGAYHHAEVVESGQFAFTVAEAGDYITCFTAIDHRPPTTLTIDFDWKMGVHANDWSSVAKKGHVEMMEFELKKLFDTVNSIHKEMFFLREREEEMQELNRTTNSKMAWLSVLSIVVCLSVAGLQIWHLKTFFEKKKLI